MRSCVERQSRVRVGQWCACPLLQAAPTSSGLFYNGFSYLDHSSFPQYVGAVFPLSLLCLNKKRFHCFYEVRDDRGQGSGDGTKNRAATPRDEINQNENS